MAKKEERFQITNVPAGLWGTAQILVDKQTGVNYLFYQNGNAGGLTPLLNREGKPVITTVLPEDK